MLLAAALSMALLAEAPAAAPAAKPQPAPAAAKAEKPKKPKMICTDEPSTDSFIPKRVCRTAEQIESERTGGRQNLEDTNDHIAQCGGRPTC